VFRIDGIASTTNKRASGWQDEARTVAEEIVLAAASEAAEAADREADLERQLRSDAEERLLRAEHDVRNLRARLAETQKAAEVARLSDRREHAKELLTFQVLPPSPPPPLRLC
jgi:molecular chaperone GrpE (heat shock protein)